MCVVQELRATDYEQREDLATIDREKLERVYANFQRRLENCIKGSGHHLPDIIFHS
jgi:hypothetical protein